MKRNLSAEARQMLEERIIPFWLSLRDDENGGFISRVDYNLKREAEAEGKQILADAREKALKEHNRIIKSAKHDIIEMVIEAENKILHKEEKNDQ